MSARILALVSCLLAAALTGAQDATWRDPRGDFLPFGAITRLGSNRLRQPVTVTCLGFTPDGKYLVSGSNTNRLLFWEVATGRLVKEWVLRIDRSYAIQFSGAGKTAAIECND